jgi:hypothetical protein
MTFNDPPLPGDTATRLPDADGSERSRLRRTRHVGMLTAIAAALLAGGLAAVFSGRSGGAADENRVRITVTTDPEPSCDVTPEVISAGVRHFEVTANTGAATVRIRDSSGALVFAFSGESTDAGTSRRAHQEMAKLVAGTYLVDCGTPNGHVRQALIVRNP